MSEAKPSSELLSAIASADIKALKDKYSAALTKVENELEQKYALTGDEKGVLNKIAQKVGKIE